MVGVIRTIFWSLVSLLQLVDFVSAADNSSNEVQYVTYQTEDGQTLYLADDRRPALYTNNFGDCLGRESAINVTRFDAAYYKDNMTIVFHFDGKSGLFNSSVMLYIGVFAYGESRFNLIFDPCSANIASLCPMNSSVPVVASGIIPVSPSDVSNIPDIAYSIPDFEGQAILRVFNNFTKSEIGCYSAIVTNGHSFSQPAAVGSVLGILTFITLVASIATSIYGEAVPTMRLHYAHSLSTGVVFSVWQHIFFTGALSVNWPSVLPAFWSNYAWAAGMIYTSSMQNSIDSFIGSNKGNTASVGAAASGSSSNVGTGTQSALLAIYRRHILRQNVVTSIHRRAVAGASTAPGFYGQLVQPGLPLPGNYSGFAGTLAEENIPVSNAFTTGIIWFAVFLLAIVGSVILLKWTLELLVRVKFLKTERLRLFRKHWIRYTVFVALRICYLAFFMVTFLTIFQFTYESATGVKALAGVIFALFVVGIPALTLYAFIFKGQRDRVLATNTDRSVLEASEVDTTQQASTVNEKPPSKLFWKRTKSADAVASAARLSGPNIHDDDLYTMRFGWMTARFRRTRWWFFTFWVLYELVRAAFYGGASGYPLAQVFGLLAVEVLSFAFMIWARPFEGQRLNILVVYCLGVSKVATVALSAAFDVKWNLGRIITTAIGIVIIVIQGILTIITILAIIISAISSYMSVSRNHEDFRPRRWTNLREKYFDHLDRLANDLPKEPKPKKEKKRKSEVLAPAEPQFAVTTVRRMNKVEDDDNDFMSEIQQHGSGSQVNVLAPPRPEGQYPNRTSGGASPIGNRSRAGSLQSLGGPSTLPYGARQHRPSWSSRDFTEQDRQVSQTEVFPPLPVQDVPEISRSTTPQKHRRTMSRGSRHSTTEVRPIVSTESLTYGGDLSSTSVIGLVPEPTARPRAGTGSRSHRRSTSFGHENQYDQSYGVESSNARRYPLTPAQELEEFIPSKRTHE